MAYSLGSERPSVAALSLNPVRAVSAWISAARAKHARRLALSRLLEMDADLLNDLGIEREDVTSALRQPDASIGMALAARRARASDDWLLHP